MMDLDEAIQHCKEQVQEQAKKGCYSCAEEHQQLAEWLRELKAYKEQSGDAISRQATVERLCRIADFMNEKRRGLGSPYVMAALFIQDNKDEFPSVTPQQRTGQWIQKGIVGGGEYIYECSECHHTDTRSRILEVPFCWFCGARMEVEE